MKKSAILIFNILIIWSNYLYSFDTTKVKFYNRYQKGVVRNGLLCGFLLVAKDTSPIGKNNQLGTGLRLGFLNEKFIRNNLSNRQDLSLTYADATNVKPLFDVDYSISTNYFFHTSNLCIIPQIHLKNSLLFYNKDVPVKDWFGIIPFEKNGQIFSSYIGFGIAAALKYKRFDLGLLYRRSFIIYQKPSPKLDGVKGLYFDNTFFLIWKISKK